MNRTDRLLAIVLELQTKKQMRAEDLAEHFEVTKRTIYRDVQALSEAGVPIVSLFGQGYALAEGYFLPPLSFNTDEAIMLLLGLHAVAQHFDAQYREAAQSASGKIKAVLTESLREAVDYLETSIRIVSFDEPAALDTLRRLRRAVLQRTTVQFGYHARSGANEADAISTRKADPYALVHVGGAWMLIAFCHTRRAIRHFRLDRMETVTLTSSQFVRPPDFTIQFEDSAERPVIVKALFDHTIARRVREKPSGFQIEQVEYPDGSLVTFAVRQPDDLLGWLLSWGAHVRVLEPDSLRDLLQRETSAMLEHYSRKNEFETG